MLRNLAKVTELIMAELMWGQGLPDPKALALLRAPVASRGPFFHLLPSASWPLTQCLPTCQSCQACPSQ